MYSFFRIVASRTCNDRNSAGRLFCGKSNTFAVFFVRQGRTFARRAADDQRVDAARDLEVDELCKRFIVNGAVFVKRSDKRRSAALKKSFHNFIVFFKKHNATRNSNCYGKSKSIHTEIARNCDAKPC